MTLELIKNPDILQEIGTLKKHQFVIGFAAETERLDEHAMDKLKRKNCDLIVGNDVSQEGAGFGGDTNVVRFLIITGLYKLCLYKARKTLHADCLSLLQIVCLARRGNPDVRQSHCRCPSETNQPGVRL